MATEIVVTVKVGSETINWFTVEYQLANGGLPSENEPAPTAGFVVHPTPLEIDGIKIWMEYRIV